MSGSWALCHGSVSNFYCNYRCSATLSVFGFLVGLVQGTKGEGTFSKRVRHRKFKD